MVLALRVKKIGWGIVGRARVVLTREIFPIGIWCVHSLSIEEHTRIYEHENSFTVSSGYRKQYRLRPLDHHRDETIHRAIRLMF